MPVVQDGPPPGGFPSIRYARRLPSTGPTGFTLFAVATAVMAFGFYRVRLPFSLHVLSSASVFEVVHEAMPNAWLTALKPGMTTFLLCLQNR